MLKMHLFSALNPLAQLRFFAGLVVLSVILILILQELDRPLQTEAVPWGIVSFELAGDLARALGILESWGASGRGHAGLSLGRDYLFLISYSMTFSLACVLSVRGLLPELRLLIRLGSLLASLSLLVGVLDALENFALIQLLLDPEWYAWPAMSHWCALLKFGILLTVLIWFVIAWLQRLTCWSGAVMT